MVGQDALDQVLASLTTLAQARRMMAAAHQSLAEASHAARVPPMNFGGFVDKPSSQPRRPRTADELWRLCGQAVEQVRNRVGCGSPGGVIRPSHRGGNGLAARRRRSVAPMAQLVGSGTRAHLPPHSRIMPSDE